MASFHSEECILNIVRERFQKLTLECIKNILTEVGVDVGVLVGVDVGVWL